MTVSNMLGIRSKDCSQRRVQAVWDVASICLMWLRERNGWCFPLTKSKKSMLRSLFFWFREYFLLGLVDPNKYCSH
ncbi:hypothetical protein CsSME_00039774 [Camellia sinensis var. sinensis]